MPILCSNETTTGTKQDIDWVGGDAAIQVYSDASSFSLDIEFMTCSAAGDENFDFSPIAEQTYTQSTVDSLISLPKGKLRVNLTAITGGQVSVSVEEFVQTVDHI